MGFSLRLCGSLNFHSVVKSFESAVSLEYRIFASQEFQMVGTTLVNAGRARSVLVRVLALAADNNNNSCNRHKAGDDAGYFQVTTEDLSVPHLMC